jgi:hypothetical protein
MFGDMCERCGVGREIMTEIRLGVFGAAEDDSPSSSKVGGQIIVEAADGETKSQSWEKLQSRPCHKQLSLLQASCCLT